MSSRSKDGAGAAVPQADSSRHSSRSRDKAALERADRLVLYRWGRHYPADRRLDLPPAGWRLEGQTEFPGRSHDMITKEIYVK